MKKPIRCEVPVDKIDFTDTRFKFRRDYNVEAYVKKQDSIRELGLLNPLKLWKEGDYYTIISGWQRAIVVINLSLPTITADVYEGITYHQALMINIHDNNMRENLSDYELACQMHALKVKDNYTVEMIAKLFHCGVDRVYDMLSTFNMDEKARGAFEKGELTLYQAVVISRFPHSERSELLRLTLEEGRSVAWLRERLSKAKPFRPVVKPGRGDFLMLDLSSWYPYDVLHDVWGWLPSKRVRKWFFKFLFGVLWSIVKQQNYSPETLIKWVIESASKEEDIKLTGADAKWGASVRADSDTRPSADTAPSR